MLPNALVGSAYAEATTWDVLEELVEIEHRMPGSDGEAEGAEVLASAFDAAGLRAVETTEFGIPGWERGASSLAVEGRRTFDADHEVVALPGAAAGDVEAELVDLGYGLPPDFEAADLEGAIAVVTASDGVPAGHDRRLHRTEKYHRAVEAGAAGFVFYSGLEGCLPPTGWAVLERPEATPGPIPAVGASHEVGARLARYCEDGATGRLTVECANDPARSRSVEAVVGPDTDREVLVTAHLDAHDLGDGARDNATGCALLAEVGRLLADLDDLDARVRLVGFGSEEVGFYGAHHWADTHDLANVKAVLNLDAIGGSRDLVVHDHGFGAVGGAVEAAGEAFDVPVRVDGGVNVFADQWAFVQRGVPGAMLRSAKGDRGRRWGLGRLWSHTHGDTLDKLDRRDLRDLAVLVTAGTAAVADADRDVEHAPPEAVREAVPDADEAEMRATGRWPW